MNYLTATVVAFGAGPQAVPGHHAALRPQQVADVDPMTREVQDARRTVLPGGRGRTVTSAGDEAESSVVGPAQIQQARERLEGIVFRTPRCPPAG